MTPRSATFVFAVLVTRVALGLLPVFGGQPPSALSLGAPSPVMDVDALDKFVARIEIVRADLSQATVTIPQHATLPSSMVLDMTVHSEIYSCGWWGDLKDFCSGQWVYVIAQRYSSNRLSVNALTDEVSMQAMFRPLTLVEYNRDRERIVFAQGMLSKRLSLRMRSSGFSPGMFSKGGSYYVNSKEVSGELLPITVFDQSSFERQRRERQQFQLQLVRARGLTTTILSNDSGRQELVLLVRRADSTFARTLYPNDEVTVVTQGQLSTTQQCTVTQLVLQQSQVRLHLRCQPDTTVRLQPGGQAFLRIQRRGAIDFDRPVDLGRSKTRADRIAFFLSTLYCTCKMPESCSCVGHWNTLANCKIHGCAMPNEVAGVIGRLIDGGKTDKQILAALEAREGPLLLKQHQLGSPFAYLFVDPATQQ
jgi:hypothetical protein